jgi:hypothetical protein
MWSAGALACDYDDVQIKHRLPKGRRFVFLPDVRFVDSTYFGRYLSKNDCNILHSATLDHSELYCLPLFSFAFDFQFWYFR